MVTEVVEKGVPTERVRRLKETLLQTPVRFSAERLKFLKGAYEETEGQPYPIRRAKVFQKVLKGMTIFIDDNPIVGTLTKHRGGLQPYPEWSCDWMRKQDKFLSYRGEVESSEEDRKLLGEAADYWSDKCVVSKAQEIWDQKHRDKDRKAIAKAVVWVDALPAPLGFASPDYEKVLRKGLNGVIGEVEAELEKLPMGVLEALTKRYTLKSMIIACNAVMDWAHRYAALAREMAQVETDRERRKELEGIAEVCEWVPAKPARDFKEAIQSFWFIHIAAWIENCHVGIAPGRFGQYMYPFYKRDRENGKINPEAATELLELLFLKMSEIQMFQAAQFQRSISGHTGQSLPIGGLTPEGEDATNELEYLILEAQRRVQLVQPALCLLYHDRLPEDFLLKAIEVVKTGIGMPAFFNNGLTIQRLLWQEGCSLEEARNYSVAGCISTFPSHAVDQGWAGYLNMPKMLELALNDGKDPATKQIGPHTGDPLTFRSYEELHEAVRKQLRYFEPLFMDWELTGHDLNAEFFPVPFISALTDDCIKRGKDVNAGGAKYVTLDTGPVGTIDLADSMANIKKLVFEEKRITMKELLEALNADFEGYEELRHMLLEAPKYGNDIEEVDKIAREWYAIFYDDCPKVNHLGKFFAPIAFSASGHFPTGRNTGALPSGRKAWLPLTDASVSPEPGKDREGLTALIRSAARVIDNSKWRSNQLNLKFHPIALRTKEGFRKLLALIKTYMDLGGYHVQFNVVSADTLKDAQLHPENYRSLVVRVAGFSAFFIHLDKKVQDELIKRTEYERV